MHQSSFREIEQIYGEKGLFKPGSWKTQSDIKFSPQDAQAVYRLLQTAGIVPPPDQDIVFLSPTANRPTHEIAMWQEDIKTRQGFSSFTAGDLTIHPDYYQMIPPSPDPSRYQFSIRQMNASTIDLPNHSVNTIWDRKGWIWHCARMETFRPEITDAFDVYARVLQPGGSIVIDAMPGFRRDRRAINDRVGRSIDNDFQFHRPPRFTPADLYIRDNIGQYEESTVDVLQTYTPTAWNEIQKRFQVRLLGDGKHQICVLTI
jgi:hypothetical protein